MRNSWIWKKYYLFRLLYFVFYLCEVSKVRYGPSRMRLGLMLLLIGSVFLVIWRSSSSSQINRLMLILLCKETGFRRRSAIIVTVIVISERTNTISMHLLLHSSSAGAKWENIWMLNKDWPVILGWLREKHVKQTAISHAMIMVSTLVSLFEKNCLSKEYEKYP